MNPKTPHKHIFLLHEGSALDRLRQIEPGSLAWAPSQHAGACGRVQRQDTGGAGGGKAQTAWKEKGGVSSRNLGCMVKMQMIIRERGGKVCREMES